MTFTDKESAFAALEEARADWLVSARVWARAYVRDGTITIEDVRRYGPPIPEGVDPRVAGVVFRGEEWEAIGYRPGTRRTSHGRPVMAYRLA